MVEIQKTKEALLEQLGFLEHRVAELEHKAQTLEQVKEDLRLSEEKYRTVFEVTGTAMMVIEPDTTILMANHKLQEVTGYPQQEAAKRSSWTQYIHEDDLPRLLSYNETREHNGGQVPNEYEFRLKHKSGAIRNCLANVSIIPGTNKRLVSIMDITDRKRAEEQKLKQMREKAESAQRRVEGLQRELVEASTFHSMVSRSAKMRELFEILPEIAQSMATVLVCGESGTGKELVARSLHELSGRKQGPFVAINCGALPDNLLESELFGHKAGAFTDARKDHPGRFALAHGGTIFLDEVGDITPALQVKLLRVLQEKVYEPLGATQPVEADVRVIAATNRDLEELVRKEQFRQDLYYRIKVLSIKLPPLRDRRCDIPLLCDHFIGILDARYGKEIRAIAQEALDILLAHDYPGNIRELENVLEHAFIFCKDREIGVAHLPEELRGQGGAITADPWLGHVKSLKDLEKLYICRILEEVGGNKSKAAKRLGIHKATLFRKLKEFGIGSTADAN